MITAVYPGTFDPITNGHEEIIRRASPLFDHLLVAVAVAVHKKSLFSLDERLEMAKVACKGYAKVEVIPFDGLLMHFVQQHQAKVILRGLRALADFDYEFQMAGMNRQLMPEVETMFLVPSEQFQFVSGTFVREIAMLGGDVSRFVSPLALQRLNHKFPNKQQSA